MDQGGGQRGHATLNEMLHTCEGGGAERLFVLLGAVLGNVPTRVRGRPLLASAGCLRCSATD